MGVAVNLGVVHLQLKLVRVLWNIRFIAVCACHAKKQVGAVGFWQVQTCDVAQTKVLSQ